jgi:hypothetical protein
MTPLFFGAKSGQPPIRRSARKYITEGADLDNIISAAFTLRRLAGVLFPATLLLLFFGFHHEHMIGSRIPRVVNADA